MERSDWIVIGISGVTCGGKTTLANQLMSALTPAHVIHQDKYFYPDDSPHHVRCKDLEHNNYDILSALDMPRLLSDVTRTLAGDIRAHASDNSRREGKWSVGGKSFLIVEGFTVLNYAPVVDICDLRYYFVLEYGECLARRVFRLYDPPDVDGYFDQCVWPEHTRYRAQIEKDPRVKIIDGTKHDAFRIVMRNLKALGASRIEDPAA